MHQFKPILVIGDVNRDIWEYTKPCTRFAPEAPIAVLTIDHTVENMGMAGNVYRNIQSLNYPVEIISNKNWESITKQRVVDLKSNHMFTRIDRNDVADRINDLDLIDFCKYAAIVISDYCKGSLDEEQIEFISEKHKLTFLDTKKKIGKWAKNITFIKINKREYENSEPYLTKSLKKKIITTLGNEGCVYLNKIYPIEEVQVRDVSGAGDSFLAGLVVKYVETNNIEKAIIYANECGTKAVSKRGVSLIND